MNARLVLTVWLVVLMLVGCAGTGDANVPTPLIAGDFERVLLLADRPRHYRLHVPPAAARGEPLPLVIMLHGGGGSGKAAATQTGWSAKADQEGFLVVYPDALPPNPDRRSSFVFNPQLWNDGSDRFYHGQAEVDDVAFIQALVDELAAQFPLDRGRVYVTGFSNGASMSFRVAAALPETISAIAPVAGALWFDPPRLSPPVPMLYITGTEDSLNPLDGGVPRLANGGSDQVRSKAKPPVRESVEKWARALKCQSQPQQVVAPAGVSRERFGPCAGDTEVVYIQVEGLGHTRAGGRSLLPEFMVGARSDVIGATDVIWEFFQRYQRSAAVTPGVGAAGNAAPDSVEE